MRQSVKQDHGFAAINQFVIDAAHISIQLDAVGRRDALDVRMAAIHNGRRAYAELLYRLPSLSIEEDDAKTIGVMLDAIRTRLHFLEKRL
jgi:hypothetical protein